MAPHQQRLRDQRLQAAMRLLGDAVFMRPARRNAARAHPVVLQHRAEARRQIPSIAGFQLVGRGRQIVTPQDGRHCAERPQRALDTGRQRLKGFAERDRHPRPVAITEHELKQQVREGLAGDRHAEVGRMREIDRGFATGHRDLLEEHLGLDAVLRPPIAKAPLERPLLPRVKLLRVARPQHLQHPFRFEDALGVASQERLDIGAPDRRKRIRTRPPIPGPFRRRRHRTGVPLPSRPQTHPTGRCCPRLGLAIHTFLPHEPNLRICDH
jgi:hypothetical protein